MAHKAIFRIKKLPSRGNIGGSGDHNYRERETFNADPNRLTRNEHTGASSTRELFAALDARLAELDEVAPQAVPLVEMLVTAAHAAFKEAGGQVDSTAYFDDARKWVEEKFGVENVIATTRHYDELTPHLVLYVVPVHRIEAKTRMRSVIVGKKPETGEQLRENREYPMPARSILSAKYWFDGRKKLSNLQSEFAAKVGAKYGLERGVEGSRARHVTVQQFYHNLQQPMAPLPKLPRITGLDMFRANTLLDAYEQRLNQTIDPILARARDRDNQVEQRFNPTDRARAEAAEQMNEQNRQRIDQLLQQVAEAEAAAEKSANIAAEQAQLAEDARLLIERQRSHINKLEVQIAELKSVDHDPLASMQP